MVKILLVDDDEDILHALDFFLKRKQFEVIAVSNGSLVEETALNTNPDIILMDINLNGYDGRKICRELRQNQNIAIPIVLFSAIAEYHQTVDEYGANGFIGKPFEMKNFIEQLTSYLN